MCEMHTKWHCLYIHTEAIKNLPTDIEGVSATTQSGWVVYWNCFRLNQLRRTISPSAEFIDELCTLAVWKTMCRGCASRSEACSRVGVQMLLWRHIWVFGTRPIQYQHPQRWRRVTWISISSFRRGRLPFTDHHARLQNAIPASGP